MKVSKYQEKPGQEKPGRPPRYKKTVRQIPRPIKDEGRVYKDQADVKRQESLEGADTKFQRDLRWAEATGQKTFDFRSKDGVTRPYAARPGKQTLSSKPPKVQRATNFMTQGAPEVPFNLKKREVAGEKKEGNSKPNVGRMAKRYAPRGQKINRGFFN